MIYSRTGPVILEGGGRTSATNSFREPGIRLLPIRQQVGLEASLNKRWQTRAADGGKR